MNRYEGNDEMQSRLLPFTTRRNIYLLKIVNKYIQEKAERPLQKNCLFFMRQSCRGVGRYADLVQLHIFRPLKIQDSL